MANYRGKIKPKRRRMEFSFDCPNANAVILTGDFNEWNIKKHPMKRNDDGLWEKIIYVFPGRHEYKFWVDGHWQMDPNNDLSCMNCYGTYNNIIVVEPKP